MDLSEQVNNLPTMGYLLYYRSSDRPPIEGFFPVKITSRFTKTGDEIHSTQEDGWGILVNNLEDLFKQFWHRNEWSGMQDYMATRNGLYSPEDLPELYKQWSAWSYDNGSIYPNLIDLKTSKSMAISLDLVGLNVSSKHGSHYETVVEKAKVV